MPKSKRRFLYKKVLFLSKNAFLWLMISLIQLFLVTLPRFKIRLFNFIILEIEKI